MRDLILSCINAFLLSVALIPVMQRFAAPLDVPTSRKNHAGHIPLVGSAMFAAFAIAALLLKEQPNGFGGFLIGLTVLVLLGVLDDLLDLRAAIKLVAQIVCVAVMPGRAGQPAYLVRAVRKRASGCNLGHHRACQERIHAAAATIEVSVDLTR
jgi:UDP-GlcNAc:undecaprenyl-phosphate/decaprenyl-phosphate GlcNAc-1-phosphate transferase